MIELEVPDFIANAHVKAPFGLDAEFPKQFYVWLHPTLGVAANTEMLCIGFLDESAARDWLWSEYQSLFSEINSVSEYLLMFTNFEHLREKCSIGKGVIIVDGMGRELARRWWA